MKQLTAKTAEQVKAWITNQSHHDVAWVTQERKELRTCEDVPAFFRLRNYQHTLYIPARLMRDIQNNLTSLHNDPSRMFVWTDDPKED